MFALRVILLYLNVNHAHIRMQQQILDLSVLFANCHMLLPVGLAQAAHPLISMTKLPRNASLAIVTA